MIYCLFFNVLYYINYNIKVHYYLVGAVAQLARAPALQAGGQEFDSPQLHHKLKSISLESQRKHIEKYIDENKVN